MKRIEKLTAAQTAKFKEWAEKWVAIGLSTEPADFDAATAAALRGYELANLKRPMVVLRMSSPYAATVGGALAWLLLKEFFGDQVGQQVGQQVRQQVEQQVWQQVWKQVGQQVGHQVGQQVEQQVRQQVGQQVWKQVEQQVWQQVRQQVRQQVEQQVWQQVEQQVGQQVWKQVEQQPFQAAKDGFLNYGINSLWSSWGAYVSFFRDVCGWDDPVLERFEIDEALMRSCGWTWWHQNVLAISDRPSAIHRDEQGRLHSESGLAIAYRDGWSLHYIHGIKVDAYIVEEPSKITVQLIEGERNAEVRRVMIERYGLEKYLLDSKAEKIHQDDFGTLYRKEISGDEALVMVKVVNSTPEPDGSFKDYFLRVPPTIMRARQAIAWTFGKEENEYEPFLET